MKTFINIFLFACIWLFQACSHEYETEIINPSDETVLFTATVQEEAAFQTRSLGDDKGEIVALPYINGIHVRKMGSPSTNADYKVKNGYKGTLLLTNGEALKWDKANATATDFFAWTTPSGVDIAVAETSGTVDFIAGNKPTSDDKDKLNEEQVTPLEVFISAQATSSWEASPSVTFPFYHLVSKLSLHVRDWDNQDVTDNVSIEFLGIKNKWNVKQDEINKRAFSITTPATPADNIKLTLSMLKKNANEYRLIYLPPLTKELNTDFATAGDFCITLGTEKYYGTLNNVQQEITGLNAGEHLYVRMDLNKNFGVGVGYQIKDWVYDKKEEIIETNPHRGIYTIEDFNLFVDAVNENDDFATLPKALYIEEGGQKIIRLYNDLTLTEEMLGIGTVGIPLTGITFDGQGYTITLPATATQGLFGTVKDVSVKNIRLKGGVISGTGSIGALIGSAENTVVENCQVLDISSVEAEAVSDIAGGLIGTAGAGVTLTNCSVETSGTISGGTAGALVGTFAGSKVENCFAVFTDGENDLSLLGSGTGMTYSYYWNRTATPSGKFWDNTGAGKDITLDKSKLVITKDDGTIISLLNALNGTGKGWVNVYGKDYPVLKIE